MTWRRGPLWPGIVRIPLTSSSVQNSSLTPLDWVSKPTHQQYLRIYRNRVKRDTPLTAIGDLEQALLMDGLIAIASHMGALSPRVPGLLWPR